jgi:hypothetical protein
MHLLACNSACLGREKQIVHGAKEGFSPIENERRYLLIAVLKPPLQNQEEL